MKSWKTTLAGLLTAIGTAFTQSGNATLVQIGGILTPIGAVLIGLFAKDSNVTGGTVSAGTTAAK